MQESFLLLVFIFGTIVGSFLNVLILRHGKNFVQGRSECPTCKKVLTWFELIPIISYFLLRGKCKGCGAQISIQYPLVELATGILFTCIFSMFYMGSFSLAFFLTLLFYFVVFSLFMVIFVYDLKHTIIPDIFSYTLAGIALLWNFLDIGTLSLVIPDMWTLLAGPILFLPFYILWKVSNGTWLGLGDGKLALGIGWLLGLSDGTTAILISFWIGAIVGLFLILTNKLFAHSKRFTMKSEIPFGPFLVIGTLLVFFFKLNLFTFVWF